MSIVSKVAMSMPDSKSSPPWVKAQLSMLCANPKMRQITKGPFVVLLAITKWSNRLVGRQFTCVVCNGDLTICVSVCQLVLVSPGYDRKLTTLSAGANDL